MAIGELTQILKRSLGTGVILLFTDFCRVENDEVLPVGIGLNPPVSEHGEADSFHLLSAASGNVARNDDKFMGQLLKSLNGDVAVFRREEPGNEWFDVTFNNVAEAVRSHFEGLNRAIEVRSQASQSDVVIRQLPAAGEVSSIVDGDRRKAPPVELLVRFDSVSFLGETNGQLPRFIEQAFDLRGGRPWKCIEVFSIDDLNDTGRLDMSLEQLRHERDGAEATLRDHANRWCESLTLYRYAYAGTYGSFWVSSEGHRRTHVSSKLLGTDIRYSPASDFVDFPPDLCHPTVEGYFELVRHTVAAETTECIFRHPVATGGDR